MALCHSCNEALIYSYHTDVIHSTYRSFLAAVKDGCYICQGLFSQAPEEWKQKLHMHNEDSELSPEKRPKVDDSETRLTWYEKKFGKYSRFGHMWLNLQIIDLQVDDSPQRVAPPKNPCQIVYPVIAEPLSWADTSFSTDSEATFSKIKIWLDRCGKKHGQCSSRRGEADAGRHPTRLIEIASDYESCQDSDDLRCRVVEVKTENTPQNLRYITLSHRWPQDQQEFEKITVDKLPRWKVSLPVKMLRQTFRDTLFVAQKLGIRYVWIDSLCIIQDGDDYADWRKESPMMQSVYSNAEFNICASKNNQNDGLFSRRNPLSPQPLQVDFLQSEEDLDYELDDIGHYLIRKEDSFKIWEAMMNDSPLVSRGWVFQEQLLSRANLHYGEHEVFFECLEMRASESLGSDQDYQFGWRTGGHFFKERLPISTGMERRTVCSEENSVSDPDGKADYLDYKRWHDLLSQYTSRQLTNSDDRLVALSGVAQYFKNFLHDDCYIAGLWRSRLATEMLWQLAENPSRENLERRKKTDRHLTFSWASVEGQVESKAEWYHDSESDVHLADLKPVKYRVPSDAMDATGFQGQLFAEDIFSLPPTPTIEIRLTGFLRPMILKQTTKQWRIRPGTREWTWEESASFSLRWKKDPWLDDQTRLDFEMSSSELDALNTSGRLFFMPLMGRDKISVRLLLLEIVETGEGKDMGRYRRIGIHNYSLDLGSLDKWLTLYVFSEDFFHNLLCWEYVDRTKRHTIFVI